MSLFFAFWLIFIVISLFSSCLLPVKTKILHYDLSKSLVFKYKDENGERIFGNVMGETNKNGHLSFILLDKEPKGVEVKVYRSFFGIELINSYNFYN